MKGSSYFGINYLSLPLRSTIENRHSNFGIPCIRHSRAVFGIDFFKKDRSIIINSETLLRREILNQKLKILIDPDRKWDQGVPTGYDFGFRIFPYGVCAAPPGLRISLGLTFPRVRCRSPWATPCRPSGTDTAGVLVIQSTIVNLQSSIDFILPGKGRVLR